MVREIAAEPQRLSHPTLLVNRRVWLEVHAADLQQAACPTFIA